MNEQERAEVMEELLSRADTCYQDAKRAQRSRIMSSYSYQEDAQLAFAEATYAQQAAQTVMLAEIGQTLAGAFGFGYDVGLSLDRIRKLLEVAG